MSTERPEFRPVESTPARRVWPFAVLGAVAVALLLLAIRKDAGAGNVRTAALADTTAIKADIGKAVAAAAQPIAAPRTEIPGALPAKVEPAQPKAPEGPNVLGGAVSAAKTVALVAKAELDRELLRTRGAKAETVAYRKQVDDLTKQLTDARAQIAAMQRAQRPPPPSDQEQILQMLAPVLRSSNDGRP
jgi:hypothetical protein